MWRKSNVIDLDGGQLPDCRRCVTKSDRESERKLRWMQLPDLRFLLLAKEFCGSRFLDDPFLHGVWIEELRVDGIFDYR